MYMALSRLITRDVDLRDRCLSLTLELPRAAFRPIDHPLIGVDMTPEFGQDFGQWLMSVLDFTQRRLDP